MTDNDERNKDWRHYFLIKDILEFPIFSAFRVKADPITYLDKAAKCVFSVTVGGLTMMNILTPSSDDNMATRLSKVSASMVLGMGLGNVAYEKVKSYGHCLYQFCANRNRKIATHPETRAYSRVSQIDSPKV
jgi:hypothetical protein